MAEAIVIEDS